MSSGRLKAAVAMVLHHRPNAMSIPSNHYVSKVVLTHAVLCSLFQTPRDDNVCINKAPVTARTPQPSARLLETNAGDLRAMIQGRVYSIITGALVCVMLT